MGVAAKLRKDKALLVCIMLVGYALSVSGSAVLTSQYVIGADFYFHLDMANFLAKGDFAGCWNYTMFYNHFPYGFLIFQMALVPSVWLGQPMLFARIAEIFLMPTTLALVMWLMVKHTSAKAAAITGLILLGGWSFMDGALQVRPESLDLLLYPIMVTAALAAKKKTFASLAVLTVFSHGLAALNNIYGIAINRLRRTGWRKTIFAAAILVLPIILISAYYVQGAWVKWSGAPATENPQELEFWTQPLTFIPIYMGSTMLGLPYLFKRGNSEFESLLRWGAIFSVVMLPLWADRWLHYVSIPLACLVGAGITRMTGKKQLIIGIAVISMFMLYYATWIMMSANGTWWQPGD